MKKGLLLSVIIHLLIFFSLKSADSLRYGQRPMIEVQLISKGALPVKSMSSGLRAKNKGTEIKRKELRRRAQNPTRVEGNRIRSAAEAGLSVYYPRRSRELNEQGDVLIKVSLGAKGEVLNLEVLRPSKFIRLNRAAQRSVYRSKFPTHAFAQTHLYNFKYRLKN